jgi:hypothetical protein
LSSVPTQPDRAAGPALALRASCGIISPEDIAAGGEPPNVKQRKGSSVT